MIEPRPEKVYISCGANMGRPLETCVKAVHSLAGSPHTTIRAVSSLYLTEPVSEIDQPWFYNFAIKAETTSSPAVFLDICQSIESELGRVRNQNGGPRTIDLDILYFGSMIIEQDFLTIPHPRVTDRKFVLVPLAEIAQDHMDPLHNKSVKKLLREVNDHHAILLYEKNWLPPSADAVRNAQVLSSKDGV